MLKNIKININHQKTKTIIIRHQNKNKNLFNIIFIQSPLMIDKGSKTAKQH
jgi:hypothetical protein